MSPIEPGVTGKKPNSQSWITENDEQRLRELERLLAIDDAVIPFDDWCWLSGFSHATGRRLIARGEVIVTHLSERRIGIRGRHHREFLDRRAATTSSAME